MLDIAKASFQEENVSRVFHQAHTVFVNAVMGYMPHFNEGTIALDELIDKNTEAVKLYGGGYFAKLKRLLPVVYLSPR